MEIAILNLGYTDALLTYLELGRLKSKEDSGFWDGSWL